MYGVSLIEVCRISYVVVLYMYVYVVFVWL